jgi:hypothetical protein
VFELKYYNEYRNKEMELHRASEVHFHIQNLLPVGEIVHIYIKIRR